MWRAALAPMLGAAMMAGCSGGQPAERSADAQDEQTEQTEPAESGVTRQEVKPEPEPVPPPIPAAIQTQPGPKGAQVALNRVAVTGDIMTVALSFSGGTCCTYTPVESVSAIDDASSQRMGVLKDNAGNWMAAPLTNNATDIRIEGSERDPAQVWFKFPAPPPTSPTVSITIPGVAPFDAVPVAR